MRVLSRRPNLPKAVACGHSEGAGFACSNGTLPLAPSPRSSPWRRMHLSDGVRGPPLGVYSGVIRMQLRPRSSPTNSRGRAHTATWGRRPLLDGVASCVRDAEPVHSAVDHTQLGPSRPPSSRL